jgi:hypothetical protein
VTYRLAITTTKCVLEAFLCENAGEMCPWIYNNGLQAAKAIRSELLVALERLVAEKQHGQLSKYFCCRERKLIGWEEELILGYKHLVRQALLDEVVTD